MNMVNGSKEERKKERKTRNERKKKPERIREKIKIKTHWWWSGSDEESNCVWTLRTLPEKSGF